MKAEENPRKLYNTKEVAHLAGDDCSPDDVARAAKKEELHYVRKGRSYLIHPKSAFAWAKKWKARKEG